jgi:hypothetical protein
VIGKRIVIATWVGLGACAVVAIPNALGLHALDTATDIVCLIVFLASLPVWLYAFGLAIVRTARGDDIAVSSWVFLAGSAPADVRKHLLGATVVSVLLWVTAWANPFIVLVSLFPLGMAALWGARHGTFPARKVAAAPTARGGRR